MSAAGGLIGALLHEQLNNPVLIAEFGGLLVFPGLTGLTVLAARIRFAGPLAWVAGAVSGFFILSGRGWPHLSRSRRTG